MAEPSKSNAESEKVAGQGAAGPSGDKKSKRQDDRQNHPEQGGKQKDAVLNTKTELHVKTGKPEVKKAGKKETRRVWNLFLTVVVWLCTLVIGYYAYLELSRTGKELQAWRVIIENRLAVLEKAPGEQRQAVKAPAVERSGNIKDGQILKALEQQLASLKKAQDSLQQKMSHGTGEDIGDLKQTIARQEQVIVQLKREISKAESALQTLQAKVEGLPAGAIKDIPVILLFDQLDKATANGEPFNLLLTRMQGYAVSVDGLEPLLEAVRPFAGQGVASREQLLQQWDRSIADFTLEVRYGKDKSAWASMQAQLDKLVKIRRIHPDENDNSAEASLARTGMLLKAGRWQEAVSKAEQDKRLQVSGAFQRWLKQAKDRVTLDATMASLQQLLARQQFSPAEGVSTTIEDAGQ